ncbi:MAG: cytochrome c oxidase accessory protein CcoG [Gammaproteobacteria bacterium]
MTETPSKPTSDRAVEEALYAKRLKIYPREVHGIFARLRVLGGAVLLGLYYCVPWLRWDDHQAVLFDLPARKFHIFALTFWPQDFFYLAVLLIIAALALFFFTTLAGRLWCGYACPQTVWTELFLWIERKVEGDRNRQIKRDRAPMNAGKLRAKATKHALWLLLSAWTGFTFVGYFTPITELWAALSSFSLGPWEAFWIFFYGLATYGNAGWLREQVCIHMCPYARFQSVMFDRDTLVIAYDEMRGEPRGPRKRSLDHRNQGLGDCVDCTLCVQVCPTGIDIRDGLQYQCIGCAACVDACDEVMEKMDYPKGLIRYTTENAMEGRLNRVLRPRIVAYGLFLLILTGGLIYAISQRIPIELDIIRDRNMLYRETDAGLVENVFTVKLINMDDRKHSYRLSVTGLPELELDMDQDTIEVAPEEVRAFVVRVRIDPVHLQHASNAVSFSAEALDDPKLHATRTGRFIGPAAGGH